MSDVPTGELMTPQQRERLEAYAAYSMTGALIPAEQLRLAFRHIVALESRTPPEPRAEHDLLYRLASAVASEEGPDLKDQEAARRWMEDEFWREERARSQETKPGSPA